MAGASVTRVYAIALACLEVRLLSIFLSNAHRVPLSRALTC